jgi:putative phosphoesterase
MRHILIISDTHNYLDHRLWKYIDACDEVWHGGDIGTIAITDEIVKHKPVQAVYGNIDGQDVRHVYPLVHRFKCEELEIAMTHIAGYPPKYNQDALKIINEKAPDIFICGHSHILKVMRDMNHHKMLFINPGAAGVLGFHPIQTVIKIKIDGKRVYDLEVVELKREKVI